MELIKKFEGFRSKAYQDSGGVWTVGYGTIFLSKKNRPVEEDDFLTEEEAEYELARFINKKINPAIETLRRTVSDIPDLLKESLVSLAYNEGNRCLSSDTLTRCLKNKNEEALASWFRMYKYIGKTVSQGLLNRRNQEVEHFLGKIWL